jgi:hypothetical protein
MKFILKTKGNKGQRILKTKIIESLYRLTTRYPHFFLNHCILSKLKLFPGEFDKTNNFFSCFKK